MRSTESVRGTNLVDTYDATGWATAGALNIGDVGTIGAFGGSLNEFEGMGGNDMITGSGDTRISFVNASGSVTVDIAAGTAIGNGSVGTDTFTGVGRVRGSNGNDTISGGFGNNTLEGQGGNDTINGRGGSDTLTGGDGNDTFVFSAVSDSPGGGTTDTITDFKNVGSDKIDFSAIDANTVAGGNDVFLFGGQNNLVVANSVTWFQSGGNTTVQADINGDTTADLTITLTGLKTLVITDFLL